MTILKKHWQLTLFIIAVLSLSVYFFYQSQQTPDLNITEVDVKTPETPTAKAPVADTSQGGHWHGDEWHAEPHAPHTPQPTADGSVQPGTSFKGMDTQPRNSQGTQLPTAQQNLPTDDTSLSLGDQDAPQVIVNRSFGHLPRRNPFLLPDYIQNNSHLFEVGSDGYFSILYPEEIAKKTNQVMDSSDEENWSDEVYIEKLAEGIAETLLAEGVSKLAAVQYISSTTAASAQYNRTLLNAARIENPNDFETLLLWARWHIKRKPAEAENVYRRLIQMQPDSDRAQFYFGYHILETDPEPREAIPALEKAYQLNPNAHAALMHLARAHKKLEQYEQALKYYQAAMARSPSRSASLGISYVKSKLAEQQTTSLSVFHLHSLLPRSAETLLLGSPAPSTIQSIPPMPSGRCYRSRS